MKKTLKLLSVLVLLFFIPNKGIGQDSIEFALTRNIELSSYSEKNEIRIEVTEGNKNLNIIITATIYFGALTIEIYDPAGEKQGNFSIANQNLLKTDKSTDTYIDPNLHRKERVDGQITKTIKNPLKGDWIIRVLPKNASGIIKIASKQSYLKDLKH